MKKLVLFALALGLLSGVAEAQTSSSDTATPGASTEQRARTGTRTRIKTSMPTLQPSVLDDDTSRPPLMPSRSRGDDAYSSIEPKGTWIGSMGIFNRSLLSSRGSRKHKTHAAASRNHLKHRLQ